VCTINKTRDIGALRELREKDPRRTSYVRLRFFLAPAHHRTSNLAGFVFVAPPIERLFVLCDLAGFVLEGVSHREVTCA